MSSVADRSVQNKVNQYFPALTGLRALAVLLVFLHHTRHNLVSKDQWLFDFLQEFDVGVSIFFVLSGFLIAHQYRKPLEEGKVSLKDYFIQRIGRILPVYWLLTIIYLLYANQTDWKVWLLNLTLLRALFKNYLFIGIGPAWSLTVEVCFYVAAPFIFLLLKQRLSLWLLTLSTLVIGILGVLLSNWLHLGSFLADFLFMLDYTFFGRCLAFFLGVILAEQFSEDQHRRKIPIWGKLPYKTAIGVSWIFICIGINLWLRKEAPFQQNWISWLMALNEFILMVPGIVFFIAGLVQEQTWLQQLLAVKPVEFMGKASFLVFLLHEGLFFEVLYFHVTKNAFFIYLIVNVIAAVGFVLYEEPARKFLVRKLAGRDRQNC